MSKFEATEIALRYADALRKDTYPITALYLFGSAAKETARETSDIDVAVVSEKLRNDDDTNLFRLWKVRRTVDTRIEPHGFTPEQFENNNDPLVYEIKKTGVLVQ